MHFLFFLSLLLSNGTKITFLAANYEIDVTSNKKKVEAFLEKGNVIARTTVNLDLTKRGPNLDPLLPNK